MLKYTQNKEVVRREVGGEVILIPMKGIKRAKGEPQQLFQLNETADYLWGLLGDPVDMDDLMFLFSKQYKVENHEAVLKDIEKMVYAMLEKGVLVSIDN